MSVGAAAAVKQLFNHLVEQIDNVATLDGVDMHSLK